LVIKSGKEEASPIGIGEMGAVASVGSGEGGRTVFRRGTAKKAVFRPVELEKKKGGG